MLITAFNCIVQPEYLIETLVHILHAVLTKQLQYDFKLQLYKS